MSYPISSVHTVIEPVEMTINTKYGGFDKLNHRCSNCGDSDKLNHRCSNCGGYDKLNHRFSFCQSEKRDTMSKIFPENLAALFSPIPWQSRSSERVVGFLDAMSKRVLSPKIR